MNYVVLTVEDLITRYCERQDCNPQKLQAVLRDQTARYAPDGWLLLECEMLDSSYLGSLTILPFGPRNTFQTIPDHPVSPRGLASDMSTVVGVYFASDEARQKHAGDHRESIAGGGTIGQGTTFPGHREV